VGGGVQLSLQRKATYFVAAILFLVISLTTATLLLAVLPQQKASLLTGSVVIARQVVRDVSQVVGMGVPLSELKDISQTLDDTVSRNAGLGYLYITDDGGRIIYRSTVVPDNLSREVVRQNQPTGPGQEMTEGVSVEVAGQRFLDVALPVSAQEKLVGVVHAGTKEEVIRVQVRNVLVRTVLGGVLLFLVVGIAVTTMVNRHVSLPLEQLAQAARQVTEGKLVVPMVKDRRDEIGDLAAAFRLMTERLSQIIGHAMLQSETLRRTSAELGEVSGRVAVLFRKLVENLEEVARSVTDLGHLSESLAVGSGELAVAANQSSTSILESTAAISEINRNLAEINQAVENISSAVVQMAATVRQVASGAEGTAAVAAENRATIARLDESIREVGSMAGRSHLLADALTGSAVDVGQRAIRETLDGIGAIREETEQAGESLKGLQERTRSIDEIITVIDEIADQTNLLALNASIISAQAGEHGKAFAVVAQEIRELSVRTADSTKTIAGLVRGVQHEVERFTESLARVGERVKHGLALGAEAGEAFEKVIVSARESSEMASRIAESTGDQTTMSRRVSEDVEGFARRAEEIKNATREETKGAEFIREAMERTRHMVEVVARATDEQNQGSRVLTESTEKTRDVAERLASATETQRSLSTALTRASESLRSLSAQGTAAIAQLNQITGVVNQVSASLDREMTAFRGTGDSAAGPSRPAGG
jgi:methyl-accepting chemotaxis protein